MTNCYNKRLEFRQDIQVQYNKGQISHLIVNPFRCFHALQHFFA